MELIKENEELSTLTYVGKLPYEKLDSDFIRIQDGSYSPVNDMVTYDEMWTDSGEAFEILGDALIFRGNFYLTSEEEPNVFMGEKRELTKLKLSDSVKILVDGAEETIEHFNDWSALGFDFRIEDGVVTEIHLKY